jgi:type II secretory pathway pseudopilin PulG
MKSRAFSLIEIVLAIGIFSFAAISIFTLLARGLQTSREARLENAAAILSGQITSLLKASYAWTPGAANNPALARFLGTNNLAKIASGAPEIRTNYYTTDLEWTNTSDADFQVTTDIKSLDQGLISTSEPNLATALSNFSRSQNAVFVRIQISYPARSPDNLRSKRDYATIVTMRSDD